MERLKIQRKQNDHEATPSKVDSSLVQQGMSGTSQALESSTRETLEPQFGHSFENIRIFADDRAAQSADALHANAYTVGSNIVFNAGRYQPNSSDGQRLIAHELTHTVQQGGVDANQTLPSELEMSNPEDSYEQAAEQMADSITSSSAPSTSGMRSSKPSTLSTEALQVQRDPDGAVVFPDANIRGLNPNVVRLPEDKIKASDADEETKTVMRNIAAARTRGVAYLEGSKTEVMLAVDTFKGHANVEIDGLDLDPSSALDLVPILMGAAGSAISLSFPPAAAAVIVATLAVGATKTVATTLIKEETADLKQNLKQGVFELGEKIKNATSAGIIKVNEQIPSKLNDLAATDKGVWELLKGGNDRQLDDVLARLSIRDPHQNSPFGNVLKSMMAAFGSWMAKAKFQKGMKGSDKLISETDISSQLNRDLRASQRAGESDEMKKAREMIEQHEKGPTP